MKTVTKDKKIESEQEWPTVEFGELASFRNGINYTNENHGEGLKVINVRNFQDLFLPNYENLDEIEPEGVVKDKDILQEEDILFVRSNGNKKLIGRSLYITDLPENLTHSAFTIRARIRSDQAYPKFYAYYLRSGIIRRILSKRGNGTNISNLNQNILENLEVPLPPLETQKTLARKISKFDQLIENNKRRIEILEEMAEAIYREWFVNFNFPGSEDVEMKDTINGAIPENFEVKEIGEVTHRDKSALVPEESPDTEFDVYNFSGYDERKLPERKLGESMGSRKYIVEKESVLIAKLNPRIPRVWLVHPDLPDRSIASTEFLVMRPQEPLTLEYLFGLLNSREFIGRFQGFTTGTSTSHQRVKITEFEGMKIAVPPEELIQTYSEKTAPIYELQHSLRLQNQTLRQTRDLLLPKLISGEIEV